MQYTHLIEQLFTQLDVLLKSYVFEGYSALAHALTKPLLLAGTIAISLFGVGLSQGWVKGNLSNVIQLVMKLGLVFAFALNWGVFSSYGYQLMNDCGSELGQVMLNAIPLPGSKLQGAGIASALQFAFNEYIHLGANAWNAGHLGLSVALQPYFGACIIWFTGAGMIVVGLFELLLAKIMMAVLLATAPLFIGFIVFKPTQVFFDRWLGAIVGYALLPLFVSAMLALSLSISQWALSDYFLHPDFATDGLNIYVITALVGLLGIFVILRVGHLSQSIGGTVTTSGASGFLVGLAMGAMSTYKNRKGKRDPSSRQTQYRGSTQDSQSSSEKFAALQQHLQQGKSL